jgi:hypothetical protein
MKRCPAVLFLAILLPVWAMAQDSLGVSVLEIPPAVQPPHLTAPSDSAAPRPARSLLPQSMSIMERGLWGESGLLRSTGIASPLTPEVRKHELDVRRVMLTAHQIGGFVTLGLMISSVYTGQQYLNSNSRSYRRLHSNLVGWTMISYGTTAGLALFSPPPLIRRDETSTTTIHKTLAWVHFVGMIVTPIIGASLRHSMNYDQLARFHQVSAYVTTAVFAASMIIITF